MTATEAFVLRSTRDDLHAVFLATFSKAKKDGRATGDGPRDVGALDDSVETHTAKVGRWTEETLANLESDVFWGRLQVGSITRRPIVHLQHWLQQTTQSTPVRQKPLPKVVEFVVTKSTDILREFETLLDHDQCHLVWQPLLDIVEGRDENTWFALAAKVSQLDWQAHFKQGRLGSAGGGGCKQIATCPLQIRTDPPSCKNRLLLH